MVVGCVVGAFLLHSWIPLLAIPVAFFGGPLSTFLWDKKVRNRLGSKWIASTPVVKKTSLFPSILALLFFLPLGIIALVFAAKAKSCVDRQDIAGAQEAAVKAKFCFWGALVCGILFGCAILMLLILAANHAD